jgi:hypothetical protein
MKFVKVQKIVNVFYLSPPSLPSFPQLSDSQKPRESLKPRGTCTCTHKQKLSQTFEEIKLNFYVKKTE